MGAAPPRAPAQDHSAGTPGSECLAIEHHPERKELVLVLGPIDLAAHSSHHAVKQLPVQEGLIPFDMTVNGYRVEAVDRHGRRVPQDVIHHINLLDPTDRELFLPIMRRVLAASHETPPVKVPDLLLGVPLEGGDRFLLLTMLHNPTAESFEGVTVRLVLNYNRSRTTPLYRVYPFHVDVMVPLGSKAYARRLEFIDLTEDRVLWRYEPDLGPQGEVKEVPVLLPRGRGIGFPIRPSHRYRVQVTYFNPTSETIAGGGMGSVAGALIPYSGKDWPAADPTDPLYAEDYANVIVSTQMDEAEGHLHDEPDPNDDGVSDHDQGD
jgi:hypothetical protein